MLNTFFILFSTIVMQVTAIAAPHDSLPDSSTPQNPQEKSKEEHANKDISTMSIAPPTMDNSKPEKTFFFSYDESLSTRLGVGYYLQVPKDPQDSDKELFYNFGIQYMFSSLSNKHIEIGFDVISQSRAYLHGGLKWIYKSTEKLRPYAKAGISQRWDRGDGMEAAVDFKSYGLKGAIGFETMTFEPMSFRIDLETIVGFDEVTFLLAAGYSWPW